MSFILQWKSISVGTILASSYYFFNGNSPGVIYGELPLTQEFLKNWYADRRDILFFNFQIIYDELARRYIDWHFQSFIEIGIKKIKEQTMGHKSNLTMYLTQATKSKNLGRN